MLESELIQRLKSGDDSAYRFVVDTYQRSVLNCCFRFVGSRETAEDLTQEVFMEVHRSIRAFRSEARLSTWLYRIAITKSLDHIKRTKRRKRFGILERILPGETPDALASDLPGPHQQLENEDRRRVLAWALASLPENQRVAFTLSKEDALSHNEVATILGTTIPAVESLIVRAKANLRKKLHVYYSKHL